MHDAEFPLETIGDYAGHSSTYMIVLDRLVQTSRLEERSADLGLEI